MPSPTTVAEFASLVNKSGVVPAKDLDGYLNRLGETAPAEPKQLATAMIRDGILTQFQADLLLKGKWRNFILNGKYKLLEFLGAGGMGSVYLCEHLAMRRRVAVKLFPPDQTADTVALERFRREARAAAALDHPNIVRAYDLDRSDNLHFLVLEFVDGSSLQQIVSDHGAFTIERACHYVAQTCAGLQHAYECSLVHRDIKPGNLLLERSGLVKILDMGLARFSNDDKDNLTKKHDGKCVLGTADYLAPEQAIDSSVDIRADIYSLGITFFFLLTGRSPFGEGSTTQKLIWHQTRKPQPIQMLREDVPDALAAVIEKMTRKDPAERYNVPNEVIAALAPWTNKPLPPPSEKEMPLLSKAARLGTDSQTPNRSGGSTIGRPMPSATAISPASVVKPASKPPERKPGRSVAGIVLTLLGVVALAIGGAVAVAFVIDPDGRKATDFSPNATRTQEPIHQHNDPAKATPPKPAPPKTYAGEVRRFKGHTGTIERLTTTSNGTFLLSASYDKTVRLWDVGSGKDLHTFTGHADAVQCVALQPDGKRFASCDAKGKVILWDLDNRQEIRRWSAHGEKRIWYVGFTPDGRWLISGGEDNVARVWGAKDGNLKATLKGHTQRVHSVGMLADNRRCLTAGVDNTIRLWEIESGKQLKEFKGHTGGVTGVTMLPDGKQFISVSHDKSARIWDLESGQVLALFSEATGQLWNLSISADGRKLATSGEDKVIRIYNVEERKLLRELRGPEKGSPALGWLPDNKRLLTGGHDQQIVLWDVEKK